MLSWPNQDLLTLSRLNDADVEVKVNAVVEREAFMRPSEYSGLGHLVRVAAWCFRFVHNVKFPTGKKSGLLSVSVTAVQVLSIWVFLVLWLVDPKIYGAKGGTQTQNSLPKMICSTFVPTHWKTLIGAHSEYLIKTFLQNTHGSHHSPSGTVHHVLSRLLQNCLAVSAAQMLLLTLTGRSMFITLVFMIECNVINVRKWL
jgi:hypothetical protein